MCAAAMPASLHADVETPPEEMAPEEVSPAPVCPDHRALAQTAAALGTQWAALETEILKAADDWLLLMLDRSLTAWKQPWKSEPLRNEEQLKAAILYFATPVRLLHPHLEIPLTFDKVPRTRAYAWYEDMYDGAGPHHHRYGPVIPAGPKESMGLADLLFYFDVHPLDATVPHDRYIIDFCIGMIAGDPEVEAAWDRFAGLASLISRIIPRDSLGVAMNAGQWPEAGATVRLLAEYDPPFRFFRRTLLNPAIRDRQRLSRQDIEAWWVSARDETAAAALLSSPEYPRRETDGAAEALAGYNRNAGPLLQTMFDAVDAADVAFTGEPAVAAAAIFLARGRTEQENVCISFEEFPGWSALISGDEHAYPDRLCGSLWQLPLTWTTVDRRQDVSRLIVSLTPDGCGMSLSLQQTE